MAQTEPDLTELDRLAGEDWPFWRVLAGAELFLLLTREAEGTELDPAVYALSDGPLILAFDREERLAAFAAPDPAPYAALPGRVIAELAAAKGLSLGLNFGTDAPSETILPPDALSWLVETLAAAPATPGDDQPQCLSAPRPEDAAILALIEAPLAALRLAVAFLARARWANGREGLLLALPGLPQEAHAPAARSMAEALALSGHDGPGLDLAFPEPGSPLFNDLSRIAWAARGEGQAEPQRPAPKGPGTDPTRPPFLR